MNAVLQTVQNMGPSRFITMALIGLFLVVIAGAMISQMMTPVMTPIYSNLSSEDSNVIATELGAIGASFEIGDNGASILVLNKDVLRLRMALARKGLPNKASIVGYEIFDKEQSLGTSNFVLNINLVRALEGELSRTISSLNSIQTARVHIVMPKRTLFERRNYEPSASVVISGGTNIGKETILAIKQVVSTSVPGLISARISIIDQNGRVLSRGDAENDEDAISAANADEMRTNYEMRMKRTLEALLEKAAGYGRVQAEVSADLMFDRIKVSEETYDPDSQVARSIQTNEEIIKNIEGDGGAVSVANNLPGAVGAGGADGSSENVERIEEVRNFEISKRITNTITEVGTVKSLSVAILIDGRYETLESEDGAITRNYIPRSDEELAQFRRLVNSAIGYDKKRGDKVEVVNMRFDYDSDDSLSNEDPLGWLKQDLDSIVKTLVLGVVAILAIILVIRPLVNHAFDFQPGDLDEGDDISFDFGGNDDIADAELLAYEPDEINLDIIQSNIETTPAKQVNDLISSNPEETVSVLRTWMIQK